MSQTNYDLIDQLTTRELQTLQGLIDCFGCYDSIAEQMGISRNTVISHAQKVYSKLGVNGKTGAVVEGLKRNLVSLYPVAGVTSSSNEAISVESLGLNPAFLLL